MPAKRPAGPRTPERLLEYDSTGRLYEAGRDTYVTFDELLAEIRAGGRFRAVCPDTGQENTHHVLLHAVTLAFHARIARQVPEFAAPGDDADPVRALLSLFGTTRAARGARTAGTGDWARPGGTQALEPDPNLSLTPPSAPPGRRW
jgi:hypothetical protein